MQINTDNADNCKIWKTFQRDLIFIFKMLLVSHKMVFLGNDVAQQCLTIPKRARAFIAKVTV